MPVTVAPWLPLRWAADRVVAAALGLVALPCVAALAVVVRVADGGPALIRLPRVGRHGAVFGLTKLRTMRADTSAGAAAGAAVSGDGDPRVTAVGRSLRRHRLDELPQLGNVVRGEMALIGPRPEAAEFVDRSDPRWVAVLAARPGIAGATQLLVHEWEERTLGGSDGAATYRSAILPLKLELDAWYVRRASPMLDLVVAVSLLQRFVAGRRTTWVHRRVARELPEVLAAVGAA